MALTRGNVTHTTVELTRGMPGTTIPAADGTRVTLGEGIGAHANRMAMTLSIPMARKARAAPNVQVFASLHQALAAAKLATNGENNVTFDELVAEIKQHGRFVGVAQEDTPYITPSAFISGGTVSIKAKMADRERTMVTPGQRLYIKLPTERTASDAHFEITIYPPTCDGGEYAQLMSQLYTGTMGTPDQNAAARYLADGIRTAMRTAMAYNPSEIDSTTLAEFVINACGFATKFNVAKRSAERSARNILEKAKGPAVERDGSGIVDRVSMEECLDAHPISAAVGGGAHHTTEDRPMREWIQNSLLLHTLPQLQLNAYDTHPVDMRPPTLISVVGKNGKVYLCTCAYSNNEWRHTGTEVHVAGLKKTTKSANYAQAAVRILCAVYALGIDAAPESLFPVISGNSGYSVEKLVACAEHACLAETLAEYEKRRALFARHYNEFGLHGFIEKHMTRAGVCFEDIQLQKTDTLDRSKLDLFVRTFKPYMGKSGNGHDALRCLGSSDNIRAMLGTMLVVSMSHLADAKCIGTFVGFDNFRDPESSIIVNVQGC